MKRTVCRIFFQPGDGGLIFVAVLLPMVSVRSGSSHVCHGLEGGGIFFMVVEENDLYAVEAVFLNVLVHESDGGFCALIGIAEGLAEVRIAPNGKDNLVVDGVVAAVGEIVFHPIRPNELFEPVEAVNVGVVFPHDGKFHQIGILGVEVALMQCPIVDLRLFDGFLDVGRRRVPAHMLNIDAVFHHEFDLPVRRFRNALVVIAECRFNVRICGDRTPAGAVVPEVADV